MSNSNGGDGEKCKACSGSGKIWVITQADISGAALTLNGIEVEGTGTTHEEPCPSCQTKPSTLELHIDTSGCKTCGRPFEIKDYYHENGSSRCLPRCPVCHPAPSTGGEKCKNPGHNDEKVDPRTIPEYSYDDSWCPKCQSILKKVHTIQKYINEERAKSPDGKTEWDRVEDFRLKHGHLPDGKKHDGCHVCHSPAPIGEGTPAAGPWARFWQETLQARKP